jgi:hypothetical protein
MSAGAPQSFHLRLVGGGDQSVTNAWPRAQQARLDVIKENRIAAHGGAATLDPRDPRWRLAMQTQAALQGSTLVPERRDRLMHNAKQLGLRAFEANLIMAIVQDRARRSESPASALRISEPTPLALIDSLPVEHASAFAPLASKHSAWSATWNWSIGLRWAAALAASAAVAILLARWVTGHS